MNKALKRVLILLLCLCIGGTSCVVASMAALPSPPKSWETIKKDSFDNFVNLLIDFSHRLITLVRYPWEPKDRTVDMSQFHLTFEDNFDGNAVDESKWFNARLDVRKGGIWNPSMVHVQDGNLTIECKYLEDGLRGPGYYTARIDTTGKYEQTYGYFECRAKLPAAQGLWSAFWLSSHTVQPGVPGIMGTEMDVFESPLYYRKNLGLENGLVTSNLHHGGYDLHHRYHNVTVAKANNPYEEFNTYGMEWNPDGYTFYINGHETGHSRYGGVSRVPAYMILSMEVDGAGGRPAHGWSGIITKNDPEALPARLVVDYVRAYQYNEPITE